eukprot:g9098.t2
MHCPCTCIVLPCSGLWQGCGEEFDGLQGLALHAGQVHGLQMDCPSPPDSGKVATQKVTRLKLPNGDFILVCLYLESVMEFQAFAAILAANAEYDVKKAFVQSLARTAASSEVLAKEHAHLNMLKRRHAELVKASRQVPCTLRRGWLAYPPRMDIPRDVRDPNFAVAFSVEDVEAAQSWMAKYGFVIFRDVISEEDCRATRNEIWSYLESKVPGFRRDDPETWRVLSETNTGRYYDAIPRSRAEDGPHIQGVLNLLDNLEEDGGTQLVPGFHNAFMEWKLELGKESEWLFKPGQHSNWLHPGNGGASFKFHEQDYAATSKLKLQTNTSSFVWKDPIQALAHRIPLKQGSLLLWDQRCVHGSRSGLSPVKIGDKNYWLAAGPNCSSRVRMAQFIPCFQAWRQQLWRAFVNPALSGQSNFLQTRLNFWSTWLPPMAVRSRLLEEGLEASQSNLTCCTVLRQMATTRGYQRPSSNCNWFPWALSAECHHLRLATKARENRLPMAGNSPSFFGGVLPEIFPLRIRTTSQGLERFLKHGFDDFFVAKRYDLPEAGMKVHRAEHHSFWHDDVSQPEVREKLLRRVNRFLGLAENTPESRDLLFIRSCACTDELREAEVPSILFGTCGHEPARFADTSSCSSDSDCNASCEQERYEGPILHAFLPGLAFFLQPLANEQEGTDGKAGHFWRLHLQKSRI